MFRATRSLSVLDGNQWAAMRVATPERANTR